MLPSEPAVPARQVFGPIDSKMRFPALDGIRALAVTAVFALHYGGGAHGGWLLRLADAIRLRGATGVDLFFVLSGFLITGILYDTRQDSQFFKRFFARRSLRIFPVAYLLFAVLGLLTPILGYHWRPAQAWFLVYMGNFAANYDNTLYGLTSVTHPNALALLNHLWSLCVEEQFYLIWPAVVWLVRDRVKLIWISGGLSVLALVLRAVVWVSTNPSNADNWIGRTLPFRMDQLLIGAILALLLRGPNADRVQRAMKWLFLAAMALILPMWTFTPMYASGVQLTIGFTLIALAAAGLIGTTLRTGSLTFRVFQWGPARVLGKYSYGFYVWHLVWLRAWLQFLIFLETKLHSLMLAGLICLPIIFLTTFLVAKLSYDLFEVRFLKLKHRFEYDSEIKAHQTVFAADGR